MWWRLQPYVARWGGTSGRGSSAPSSASASSPGGKQGPRVKQWWGRSFGSRECTGGADSSHRAWGEPTIAGRQGKWGESGNEPRKVCGSTGAHRAPITQSPEPKTPPDLPPTPPHTRATSSLLEAIVASRGATRAVLATCSAAVVAQQRHEPAVLGVLLGPISPELPISLDISIWIELPISLELGRISAELPRAVWPRWRRRLP